MTLQEIRWGIGTTLASSIRVPSIQTSNSVFLNFIDDPHFIQQNIQQHDTSLYKAMDPLGHALKPVLKPALYPT